MPDKILIDASHEEETRMVLLSNDRIEEFDVESSNRKQLRGNIYLAKVTRVEPSLQAAFVDYGGNRHGFLAFSEIHPDYYQIPLSDRQALIEETIRDEKADYVAENWNEEDQEEIPSDSPDRKEDCIDVIHTSEKEYEEKRDSKQAHFPGITKAGIPLEQFSANDGDRNEEEDNSFSQKIQAENTEENNEEISERSTEDEKIESVGTLDALEEMPVQRSNRQHRYKIQEVIKRRQILLIQIVREERGNKGAALTTYLSIAGRYCVLMPNSARGGGISRKITSLSDRRKLKTVSEEMQQQLPEGMGVILRTAGANRTKAEIKRDFEYLVHLWEAVRELTLESTAPTLVYEEGNLIKRSIRDLYSKEMEMILISGEKAYREAKMFMRMLMPSHAKFVQAYKNKRPIFSRHGVEEQLESIFSPRITLRSGGYIVINQTEALVAIDVNSGRSTRENNIENTALSTNLEAAEEISRQLRLRDLAGLIVIDFIDMEEKRSQRAVERKLKDYLRHDRARIQVGRISHFGLLEMSRQRIRIGAPEGLSVHCSHCQGLGSIRSPESVALKLLRNIEDTLIRRGPGNITAQLNSDAAFYILNQKRERLRELEKQFGTVIVISGNDSAVYTPCVLEYKELVRKTETFCIAPSDIVENKLQKEENTDEGTATGNEDLSSNGKEGAIAVGQKRTDRRDGRWRQRREARVKNKEQNETGDLADGNAKKVETASAADEATPGDEVKWEPHRRRGRLGNRKNNSVASSPAHSEKVEVDTVKLRTGDKNEAQLQERQPKSRNAQPQTKNGTEETTTRTETEKAGNDATEEKKKNTETDGRNPLPSLPEAEASPKRGWWRRIRSG